jgi:hypothetical protein
MTGGSHMQSPAPVASSARGRAEEVPEEVERLKVRQTQPKGAPCFPLTLGLPLVVLQKVLSRAQVGASRSLRAQRV